MCRVNDAYLRYQLILISGLFLRVFLHFFFALISSSSIIAVYRRENLFHFLLNYLMIRENIRSYPMKIFSKYSPHSIYSSIINESEKLTSHIWINFDLIAKCFRGQKWITLLSLLSGILRQNKIEKEVAVKVVRYGGGNTVYYFIRKFIIFSSS